MVAYTRRRLFVPGTGSSPASLHQISPKEEVCIGFETIPIIANFTTIGLRIALCCRDRHAEGLPADEVTHGLAFAPARLNERADERIFVEQTRGHLSDQL